MLDDVLHVMAKYDNICEYIHLPVQSGNSEVLERMNRTYDRAWYMNRIEAIRPKNSSYGCDFYGYYSWILRRNRRTTQRDIVHNGGGQVRDGLHVLLL